MMKSLAALAALATMSMAKKGRWPKLIVDYDVPVNEEDEDMVRVDYLALVEGVPAEIKYPFDWRQRKGECEGWVIVDEPAGGFKSFFYEHTKPGKWCSKLELNVNPDGKNAEGEFDCEPIIFENKCDPAVDEEGAELE